MPIKALATKISILKSGLAQSNPSAAPTPQSSCISHGTHRNQPCLVLMVHGRIRENEAPGNGEIEKTRGAFMACTTVCAQVVYRPADC